MVKHAILGTDFSKAISKIISGSDIIKQIGIEKINLVHVLNLRDVIMVEKFTIEGLEQKLEEERALLSAKGFDVTAELIYGIPHIELERKREEAGAGLIIVGSHGRTSSSSIIGGTIADVLQNMKAPVLVIPLKKIVKSDDEEILTRNFYQYEQIMRQLDSFEPDWELKCNSISEHVLIPTDFSDFSENAFQWLKNQKTSIPAVTLLHIQDEVKIGGHLKEKLAEFNNIDTERLKRLKESLQASHPETVVSTEIIYGRPTQEILKFIKEKNVSLTVMGSQGRGFFAEIFIGSVSHQVTRNSNSNVLIVPLATR